MKTQPSWWRGVGQQAGILLMAATGLGLVVPLPASASCAGPQLALAQSGVPVPARRVGEGESERLLYDVTRELPLQVKGSNLTFDCHDTYAVGRRGCGPPVPDRVEPIVPLHDAEIVLTQRGRSWTLADVGTIGPDLTAVLDVTLPDDLGPGPATLSLVDRQQMSGSQLELVVS